MRNLSRLAAVLLLVLIGLGVYLALPVLRPPSTVDLSNLLRRTEGLFRSVPEDAGDVFVIPAAGATYRRLRRHEVLGAGARRLEQQNHLRGIHWLLGGADVLAWRTHRGSGLTAELDPLRSLLLRSLGHEVRDGLLIVGPRGEGIQPPLLDAPLSGHLFVIHRAAARSAFPPLRRPALTAAIVDERIELRTVSLNRQNPADPVLRRGLLPIPNSAMMAATFASAPELIQRIEQTLPVEISPLLQDGGLLALYRLNDERLLPRPRGVIAVPVSDETFPALRRRLESLSPELPFGSAKQSRREVMGREIVRRESTGFTLEYTRWNEALLVAFDKSSIELFLADEIRSLDTAGRAVEWAIRLDPPQLVPALETMRAHAGLRVLLPEVGREIEELHRLVEGFGSASEIVAMKGERDGRSELEIRILPPK